MTEKLIQINDQDHIQISDADPKVRLLSAFAHLYDVNVVVKDAEKEDKEK